VGFEEVLLTKLYEGDSPLVEKNFQPISSLEVNPEYKVYVQGHAEIPCEAALELRASLRRETEAGIPFTQLTDLMVRINRIVDGSLQQYTSD